MPPVARVPQRPSSLLGMANLRGTVIAGGQPARRCWAATESVDAAGAGDRAGRRGAGGAGGRRGRRAGLARRGARRNAAGRTGGRAGRGAARRASSGADQDVAKILDIHGLLAAAFAQRARPRGQRASGHARGCDQEPTTPAGPASDAGDLRGRRPGICPRLDAVQEIVPAPDIRGAAFPAPKRWCWALTAFRDSLLPLLSLRGLLGFPPAERAERAREGGRHRGRRRARSAWWPTACARSSAPIPS